MAESAIESLLESMRQLLIHNVEMIVGVKVQIESLYNELNMLNVFLKEVQATRSDYALAKVFVRQIGYLVLETEDLIDSLVSLVAARRSKSSIEKAFHAFDHTAGLRNIAKEIQAIQQKMKDIYDNKVFGLEALKSGESNSQGSRSSGRVKGIPLLEPEEVVGLEDERKVIVERLLGGGTELEVVSIVGMAGIGKTTLAHKVYIQPDVQYHFDARAWVSVSQEYNRRELFLNILNSIAPVSGKEVSGISEEDLAEYVRQRLKGKKYLIVLDDVWTTEVWNVLKISFPNDDCGSRVLLTSRNMTVGLYANPTGNIHRMRFLSQEESFELLLKKVFGKVGKSPPELTEISKEIASKCYGLPLAVVMIAGYLRTKATMTDWWMKVAKQMSSYLTVEGDQPMSAILSLSYDDLPYFLKPCFLYLGAFPADIEIPVWKLILLWIAEGFIHTKSDMNLEDVAEEYLEELVERNLVMVATRRHDGRIKSCRVHNILLDLCLKNASEESFFAYYSSTSTPIPAVDQSCRRLVVHSRILDSASSPQLRSFLYFARQDQVMSIDQLPPFFKSFKFIKVLDIMPLDLLRFPKDLLRLFHLRYVALSCNFKVLPASITEWWNLQTLIVQTKSPYIYLKADLFSLLNFRHLRINASILLDGPDVKAKKGGKNYLRTTNIQTITTLAPECCTEDVLSRTPNLRKLGIRGKLAILVGEGGGSSLFDNISRLDHLENLKLIDDTTDRGNPPALLPWYKFPSHLKNLTLSHTFLDWKHVSSELGLLPNLEVLKLKDNASMGGGVWVTLDGGFPSLKVLQIVRTDLVKWEVSEYHFPRLRRLVLRQCTELEEIPFCLAMIPTLQSVELDRISSSAAASAKLIVKEKQDTGDESFKLSIYPPDV